MKIFLNSRRLLKDPNGEIKSFRDEIVGHRSYIVNRILVCFGGNDEI